MDGGKEDSNKFNYTRYSVASLYTAVYLLHHLLDVVTLSRLGNACHYSTCTRRPRSTSNYSSHVQLCIYWTTVLYFMQEIYKIATEKMGVSTDADVDTGFTSDPDGIYLGCDNHYLWITT